MEFRQFRINFISRKFESCVIKFNINSISISIFNINDKKTSKFIKTNKHIEALNETSLPLKKSRDFETLHEKIKSARGT